MMKELSAPPSLGCRKRKRFNTSPSRVIKRPNRAIDQEEMRPFIKQIESLKAENYQLQQMVNPAPDAPRSISIPSNYYLQSKIEKLTVKNEALHEQITEFQVKIEHDNHHLAEHDATVMVLKNKNEILLKQLVAFQHDNEEKTLSNQKYMAQVEDLNRQHLVTEYAKNVLSESLHQLIRDYRVLSQEYTAKTSFYLDETCSLKKDLIKMKVSYKDGCNEIARTAKDELRKIKVENEQLKSVLDELLNNSDKAMVSMVKCCVCLDYKNTSDMAINIPCGHMHCETCINMWRSKHPRKSKPCPSCRTKVTKTVKIYS